MAFQLSHSDLELHKACEVLISAITEETQRRDLANPWSNEELEFLRSLVHVRTADKSLTYTAAVEEVKKLLNIKDRTLKFE